MNAVYDDIGVGDISEEEETNLSFNIEDYFPNSKTIDVYDDSSNIDVYKWNYKPLYSERGSGEVRIWMIGFDTESQNIQIVHGTFITTKGEMGKLQTTYHPVILNKSGRSMREQSFLQARRRFMNKYKEGYLPKGEELPAHLAGTKPMLANKYKRPDKNNGKTNVKKFPVSVMQKIDGIRALSRLRGNNIDIRSRLNNLFPHLQHIKQELLDFMRYLPVNSELDGELYVDGLEFTALTSIVKRVKTLHPQHHKLQYWIFDIITPGNLVWEKRYTLMVNALKAYVKDGGSAKTFKILQIYNAYNADDILKYHQQFVGEGYEGVMIRRYGSVDGEKASVYKSNRNNNLIKYKEFQDEEVTIIGYEKCVGTEEGAVKFLVKDKRGNQFPVRPKGSIKERRKWFQEGNNFIGKEMTIRFQELSEHGVPRFPVGIAIRDYE